LHQNNETNEQNSHECLTKTMKSEACEYFWRYNVQITRWAQRYFWIFLREGKCSRRVWWPRTWLNSIVHKTHWWSTW
jgi:hypothetical protein